MTWNPDQSKFSPDKTFIALDITSNLELERKVEKGPHAICFRIPPADVKPPSDVDVVVMRSVTFRLNIRWNNETSTRKRSSKRPTLQNSTSNNANSTEDVVQPRDEPLLFDDSLLLSQDSIDSGYNSLLSSQSDQDEEMLMVGMGMTEVNEEDGDMLLNDHQEVAINMDETKAPNHEHTFAAPEDSLLFDHEELPTGRETMEDFFNDLDDEENALYDFEDWSDNEHLFANEEIDSTFDPLEPGAKYFNILELESLSQQSFVRYTALPDEEATHDTTRTIPICSKKRSTSTAFTDLGGPTDDDASRFHDLTTTLVRAALKVAICGNPGRLMRAKSLLSDRMARKLQHIAPVVWTPKYQEAVATRAALMPTIGHAFFKSFRKNAMSAELKESFKKLGDRHQTALWEMVKRGLAEEKQL